MKSLPSKHVPVDYLMALRGMAVIGVALGHLAGLGRLSIGAVVTKGPWNFVEHDAPFEMWRTLTEIATPLIGRNFVILFFVQSGYLMGKVFFDERYSFTAKKSFYWARYLRLAPALYVNLVICALFSAYANNDALMMAGDFLFVNNFTGRGINLVTWSLSHEMQYYLLAPFVFALFSRPTSFRLPVLLLLICGTFYVGRYLQPFAFLFTFLLGFGVNLIPRPKVTLRIKKSALVAGICALHLGFNWLAFYHLNQLADAEAAMVSAFLVWMCETKSETSERSTVLHLSVLAGYLTYGFYLWHYPVLRDFGGTFERWAANLAPVGWPQTLLYHLFEFTIALPLSFALAYFSFAFIESKFRPTLYEPVARQNRSAADRGEKLARG